MTIKKYSLNKYLFNKLKNKIEKKHSRGQPVLTKDVNKLLELEKKVNG